MTLARPESGCVLVAFEGALPIGEASEVALEDYARVLARAGAAEAAPVEGEPGMVRGVHLCGAAQPLPPATLADIEGFARSLLALRAGGLGWS